MKQLSGGRAMVKLLTVALLLVQGLYALSMGANPKILVYSEIGQWRDPAHTVPGFTHGSIPAGKTMLTKMGTDHAIDFTFADNSSAFTDAGLAPYQAVVFLNPNGYVLNADERLAFQKFIRSGKGYVGIHAAANCELDWSWYVSLIGVYETGVDANNTNGTVIVKDNTHVSTQSLPSTFTAKDEWLKYNADLRTLSDKSFKVLAVVDEKSYNPASTKDHPISWYHEYDGGRVWYTGFGHESAVFSNQYVIDHIWGGIQYALGTAVPPASPVTTVNDFTTGTGLNQFEFSSGWTGESQAGNYNNDGHFSSAINSYYQVRFYGTQIKVYSKTETPHGVEAISIDGGAETLVDEYSATILYQQNIFTSPVLPRGNHTLKVRVTGTKNALASNTFVYADRVDIFNDSTPVTAAKKILCLNMCAGFVHGSIKPTVKMLMELGAANGFTVDSTGNGANVTSANLAKYDAIAFNNTTGEFLNAEQKTAIETYVKSGKGVFGIHAAVDAFNSGGKTTWQFYTDMFGAIFKNHPGNPNVQTATVKVENRTHPATINLPATLSLKDEWYNFYQNVRGISGFNILMSLDESTYSPESGAMGDHPIAWYHTFNSSRVIYTGIGHNDVDLFKDQNVRNHFLGCVQYALGNSSTPVMSRKSQPEKKSSVTITNRNYGEIIISQNSLAGFDLVKVQLLSLDGTAIQELPFAKISGGVYLATYGTSGAFGHPVPKGTYIVSAVSESGRAAQKIIIGH